jgi:hypothetical protein
VPILAGNFTSPILSNKYSFFFSKSAESNRENKYDLYYEIELLTLPLKPKQQQSFRGLRIGIGVGGGKQTCGL